MKTPVHKGYLVTFVDGLGHPKEMMFLKEREFHARDAAARLHGSCHDVFIFVEEEQKSIPKAETVSTQAPDTKNG